MSGRKYSGCLDFRVILSVCAALLIVGVWASTAPANNVPPTPSLHFYGDSNGDMIIDASDLAQMKAFTLGLPYTYDTLQPQTYSQAWNTGDLTSDRIIDAADISAAKMYTLGLPVSIADKPWVLQNMTLPLSGNLINIWIPLSFSLASTNGGLVGKPGFSIVAEIAPVGSGSTGTGQIKGRSCSPAPGAGRDQTTLDGAQCALAVTVTDWGAHPDLGLTESGTYGLQVKMDGNGDIKLNLSVQAIPGLDIPAVTLSMILGNDQFAMSCPASANENAAFSCTVSTASGPSTCAIGSGDTCGGSIDSACAGPYNAPVPGEAKGPGTCVAEVLKGLQKSATTINILEVNEPPHLVNPPAFMMCSYFNGCGAYISTTDPDLPNSSPGNPGYVYCRCDWTYSIHLGVYGSCDSPNFPYLPFAYFNGQGPGDSTSCTFGVPSCTWIGGAMIGVSIHDGYGASSQSVIQLQCTQ